MGHASGGHGWSSIIEPIITNKDVEKELELKINKLKGRNKNV